jgi:hypothetical protein
MSHQNPMALDQEESRTAYPHPCYPLGLPTQILLHRRRRGSPFARVLLCSNSIKLHIQSLKGVRGSTQCKSLNPTDEYCAQAPHGPFGAGGRGKAGLPSSFGLRTSGVAFQTFCAKSHCK